MIIVGAKGLAKELLQIVSVDMKFPDKDIVFFDNITQDLTQRIYDRFEILNSYESVEAYMSKSEANSFVLGLGNPKLRAQLFNQFIQFGAKPLSIISNTAEIGHFGVTINEGTSIMSGARISNSVKIGKGCLVYYNSIITHDCKIGDFVEVSPNVTVLGRCNIGDYTTLGASSVILPDVVVGKNVTVGAGTVVTKDVSDNCTIMGVPGRVVLKEENK
ncbi:acetyltransferase [Psychroserpens sp. MEBiC05023]